MYIHVGITGVVSQLCKMISKTTHKYLHAVLKKIDKRFVFLLFWIKHVRIILTFNLVDFQIIIN